MAPHPLDGAEAKVRRGSDHRKTLRAEIRAFLDTKPYRVSVDFDPETGWHVASLRVLNEPALRLSIIAGEVAYEYISALNHVVWALAAQRLGQERLWKCRNAVQFPITTSPEFFAEQALVRKKYVTENALAVIEGLQPYNGPEGESGARGHTLWLTKEIADADKHRVLAPGITQIILEGLKFEWDPVISSDPEFETLVVPNQRLDDGTKIARVRFAVGNDEADVYVDGELPTDILFGAGEWALTTRDLGNTHAYMSVALRRLATLFPDRNQ